jgi:hypothetical protein
MRIMALEVVLPILQDKVKSKGDCLTILHQEMGVHCEVVKALDESQDQHRLVTIDDTMVVLDQIWNIKECHCGDSVPGLAEDPIKVGDLEGKEDAISEPRSQLDFHRSSGFEPEARIALGLEEDDLVGGLLKGFNLSLTPP